MCTGRVNLEMILRAFSNGADGVFIGGCRLGECNYTTQGNLDALATVHLCRKILKYIGVNPERLRIEFMTSGDGILFANIMNGFGRQIKDLGPIGSGEEAELIDIKSRIPKIIRLVPYIKIKTNEKLGVHFESPGDYENLFSDKDIERFFGEVESYYIDPGKCQACGICAGVCPVGAISGRKKTPYVINQDECIKCGTCMESCPSRFSAINRQISQLF